MTEEILNKRIELLEKKVECLLTNTYYDPK